MITNPIIPIWLMSVLCIIMLFLKRRGIIPYIRQIIIIILIFLINLRISVPDKEAVGQSQQMDAYVLFVVDDTISMVARDYNGETERLTAAQTDCDYIIDQLYGAKFSVISFNNEAQILSPFTDDGEFAKSVIHSIGPLNEYYAKGSSFGVCQEAMTKALKNAKDKNNGKVIVFFISDGEITKDEKLSSFGRMRDYVNGGAVLGYGTDSGGKMYVTSYFDEEPHVLEDTTDYPYKDAISKIDEGNLKKIASDMDISYVHMTKKNDIDSTIEKIKNNLATSISETKSEGYREIYYIFAMPLVVLLIYEFIDLKRRVRRDK